MIFFSKRLIDHGAICSIIANSTRTDQIAVKEFEFSRWSIVNFHMIVGNQERGCKEKYRLLQETKSAAARREVDYLLLTTEYTLIYIFDNGDLNTIIKKGAIDSLSKMYMQSLSKM